MVDRANSLTREMDDSRLSPTLDSLPRTDIDELADSIDDESPPTPDGSNSHIVESWLDSKSPHENGHSLIEKESTDRMSIRSDSTSERRKVRFYEIFIV